MTFRQDANIKATFQRAVHINSKEINDGKRKNAPTSYALEIKTIRKIKKLYISKKELMITKDKISEIVNKIASGYNPEKIILFGSYADGKPTENSDVDIFVIKDSELPRPQRTMQLRRMLFGSKIPIDLIVYTPNEVESEKDEKYSFVYEVLNFGKTVY